MVADGPYFRLESEAAAFPFWAEVAFQSVCIELSHNAEGRLDGPTDALAGELEDFLRLRGGGVPLESIRQLRERVWFPGQAPTVPLEVLLVQLAQDRLDPAGPTVRIRTSVNLNRPLERETTRWRWLSFALPTDLLVAARYAATAGDPPADHPALASPQLDTFLRDAQEGVVETHLHAGAAIPFDLLWTNLMTRVAGGRLTAADLGDPRRGPTPFGAGYTYLQWLKVAALVRLLLASFLWGRGVGGPQRLDVFLSSPPINPMYPNDDADILQAVDALIGYGPPPAVPVLGAIYRRYSGQLQGTRPPRSPLEVIQRDPLAQWVPGSGGATPLPETLFLTSCLRYLLQAGPDRAFARVFWQYVRIRGRTFRWLTEETGTAGFEWFRRHFMRISPLRLDLRDEALVSSALRVESRNARLRSLEIRMTPKACWHSVRDQVRAVANASSPEEEFPPLNLGEQPPPETGRPPERGLVLHLPKDWAPNATDRLYADPRQLAFGARYGSYYNQRFYEALAVETALATDPSILVFLRGADVCNLELAIPTWVVLPLLQRIRTSSEGAAQVLSAQLGHRVDPMHLTMHQGEDFRRLVDGLRRVHEPVEFDLLRQGDRFGHAIVLALDPRQWAARAPMVVQPLEERLDDLLWEMARYQRQELGCEQNRLEYVRSQIVALGRRQYGRNDLDVDHFLAARRLRHQPEALQMFGYPVVAASGWTPRRRQRLWSLLHAFLTDPDVYDRGQEPIEVRITDAEVTMLIQAQHFLRELLGRLEIAVEANPSSNLLIGGLIDLREHPVFGLQSLGTEPSDIGPVLVSLGDDNPVTFNTCLPEEVAYLYFALIEQGYPAQTALEWLRQVFRNAWGCRFTLPESRLTEWRELVGGATPPTPP